MIRKLVLVGALLLVGMLAALGTGLSLASHREAAHSAEDRVSESLALFEIPDDCPQIAFASRAAARAESQGILLSERYPYDPRDGVRAVQRLREAQRCYEAAGAGDATRRTRRLASALAARIEVDFASSRLALESAIADAKWSIAQRELRKLLRLTEHRREHPFAEHLRSIAGKVAIRASNVR